MQDGNNKMKQGRQKKGNSLLGCSFSAQEATPALAAVVAVGEQVLLAVKVLETLQRGIKRACFPHRYIQSREGLPLFLHQSPFPSSSCSDGSGTAGTFPAAWCASSTAVKFEFWPPSWLFSGNVCTHREAHTVTLTHTLYLGKLHCPGEKSLA